VLAAAGVPTDKRPTFDNTGIPLTGGCTASLWFSNPGENVKCSASAPTRGANSFNCNGNASFRVTEDDDDIRGNVFIPQGSGAPTTSALRPVVKAKRGPPGLIRPGDLPARGWKAMTKISQLGLVGKLWKTGTTPASCETPGSAEEPAPVKGGGSAFHRPGRVVGDIYGVYSGSSVSRATLSDAVSAKSMTCFAKILSSKRFHSRATARRVGGVHRIVIRSGGRTDYVDVAGVQRGEANALVFFIKYKQPFAADVEQAVVSAVSKRLAGQARPSFWPNTLLAGGR